MEQNNPRSFKKQIYDFLFVLDFEATCWEKTDPGRKEQEIIEFSVVLYDVHRQMVLSEFQQYVKPIWNPILSEFCKTLTGIQQYQVDNGVDLQVCLERFDKWISPLLSNHHITMGRQCLLKPRGIFVTWSDWDLGICLRKECIRKQIYKAPYFRDRIDLRKLYIKMYKRCPSSLRGALNEVGLNFEGQEHCGLYDAKNTAKLAGKMVSEGIIIEVLQ